MTTETKTRHAVEAKFRRQAIDPDEKYLNAATEWVIDNAADIAATLLEPLGVGTMWQIKKLREQLMEYMEKDTAKAVALSGGRPSRIAER